MFFFYNLVKLLSLRIFIGFFMPFIFLTLLDNEFTLQLNIMAFLKENSFFEIVIILSVLLLLVLLLLVGSANSNAIQLVEQESLPCE